MKYLDTAFRQLSLAIKLMTAAEDGRLKVNEIDTPLRIEGLPSTLILPDRVLDSQDDLILACQNNVTIAFGAAAITLNRCREEMKILLPDPINSEPEQWIALVYQIRNAFAHDIAEPRWSLKPRFAREYRVEGVRADLTALHHEIFDYAHIGGADALFRLREYAHKQIFR